MFFKKKKKKWPSTSSKEKQQGSSYSPLQIFSLPITPPGIPLANIMGSSLASVIIVSVRLCREAGSERACVYTYIGGGCESEFCHSCVVVHWCTVQGLDCEHDKCVICELRMSIYKGEM